MSWSRRSRATAAAVAALTALLAGCGSRSAAPAAAGGRRDAGSAGSAGPSGSITVFAAASLTGPFSTLGRRFEAAHPGTTVRFSFGASSTLAQQIVSGAPADVFASASVRNMTTVVDAGDASSPEPFATNVAAVAVSPGSAGTVTALRDLAAPGVKVALCQPEVPCGALARTVLAKARLKVTPVTRGLDVKAVLATVASGEVDAGIVYVTDVQAAGGKVRGVPVPAPVNAATTYPIATVRTSRNAALGRAFQAYVLSAEGRAVLARAGFAGP